MKILVLNGSPKRDRSDVMHVTNAFIEGMREAAPQDVRVLHTVDAHIKYCTGCFSCMRNGGTCVHDDDMKGILEEILGTDLLILSFPLYCYGMPASLKALIDRTLPLSGMAMRRSGDRYVHVGQRDFSRLRYMMICGCGFPNSRHNFEPAVEQFGLLFPHVENTVLTVPESPLFNVPGAETVTGPKLALVRKAGKQYAETGAVGEALAGEIRSPMIPEEEYAGIVNRGAR